MKLSISDIYRNIKSDKPHFRTEKAAQQFRKMNYSSSYSRFFGKYTQPTKGEAEILKYKKFTELDISSILTPLAQAYIENWTLLDEDETYLNLALCVIRSIYTYIKNLEPKISVNTETYFWPKKHQIVQVSRFDTLERAIKKNAHKNVHNMRYNELMRNASQKHFDKVEF